MIGQVVHQEGLDLGQATLGSQIVSIEKRATQPNKSAKTVDEVLSSFN